MWQAWWLRVVLTAQAVLPPCHALHVVGNRDGTVAPMHHLKRVKVVGLADALEPPGPEVILASASDKQVEAGDKNGSNSSLAVPTDADESDASFCNAPQRKGYVNVHGDEESEDILLDLTDALHSGEGVMRALVTVMAARGTYSAETGQQLMPLSSPLEDTPHQMLELSLSPSGTEVDVYSPQLRIRTSDKDSEEALRMGTGGGRLGSLSRVTCSPSTSNGAGVDARTKANMLRKLERDEVAKEKRVVVALGSLLNRGFFAVGDMDSWTLGDKQYKRISSRILRLKSFPKNLDVTMEIMLGLQTSNRQVPLTVAFSMVKLPKKPMAPRQSDNRLGFFTTRYADLGFHPGEINISVSPSATVDAERTMIWRYNLQRDPDKQIKIYIDPTVPMRWRKYVKEGIEAWNDGFAMFGANNTMKAISPGDPDWPEDYDQGDARYTMVSWVLDTNKVVSRGHARVDPRSGEIMKSEISMSVGWLHAWLSDVDRLAPQLTQQFSNGFLLEERAELIEKHEAAATAEALLDAGVRKPEQVADDDWVDLQGQPGEQDPKDREQHQEQAHLKIAALVGEQQGVNEGFKRLLEGSSGRLGLLGVPMTPRQQEELLGAGIKQIMMHETGHILGLRHNFKGSLGVSYECTQDKACSGVHGLSSSVMDYLPINLPDNDDPDSVHFFSPVIGQYDKLAIAYGYMPMQGRSRKIAERAGLSLDGLLSKAEAFQVCLDGDSSQGEDPQCRPYDFTSDPIRYFESTLSKHRRVQQHLLDTAVAPGKPYFHYGNAVASLMGLTEDLGVKVARYIGGVNSSYAHRSYFGLHNGEAVRPVSAHLQRRALGVVKQVLQLSSSGLMPPSTGRRFLVIGQDDQIQSLNVAHASRKIQKEVMSYVLKPSRFERLYDHSGDCEGGHEAGCPLTVDELLAELVATFGIPWNATSPDWNVQLELVQDLKAAAEEPTLSAEVVSIILHELEHIRTVTEAALQRGDSLHSWVASSWALCAKEGDHCACRGQVRYGVMEHWSEPQRVADGVACGNAAFKDPKPHRSKVCQCLSEAAGAQEHWHAHLLRLRRLLDLNSKADK